MVDEAHRLKNYNAKILLALKRMPCKRTLLLTGNLFFFLNIILFFMWIFHINLYVDISY